MTALDVQARRDICADCTHPCEEARAGRIEVRDPCAACPRRIWHAHDDCAEGAGALVEEASATPQPPIPGAWTRLRQRVRGYRLLGQMVGPAERHARREACAGCSAGRPTAIRGLYRCTHRACGCGGGDELRMVMPGSACKAGKWPIKP